MEYEDRVENGRYWNRSLHQTLLKNALWKECCRSVLRGLLKVLKSFTGRRFCSNGSWGSLSFLFFLKTAIIFLSRGDITNFTKRFPHCWCWERILNEPHLTDYPQSIHFWRRYTSLVLKMAEESGHLERDSSQSTRTFFLGRATNSRETLLKTRFRKCP